MLHTTGASKSAPVDGISLRARPARTASVGVSTDAPVPAVSPVCPIWMSASADAQALIDSLAGEGAVPEVELPVRLTMSVDHPSRRSMQLAVPS